MAVPGYSSREHPENNVRTGRGLYPVGSHSGNAGDSSALLPCFLLLVLNLTPLLMLLLSFAALLPCSLLLLLLLQSVSLLPTFLHVWHLTRSAMLRNACVAEAANASYWSEYRGCNRSRQWCTKHVGAIPRQHFVQQNACNESIRHFDDICIVLHRILKIKRDFYKSRWSKSVFVQKSMVRLQEQCFVVAFRWKFSSLRWQFSEAKESALANIRSLSTRQEPGAHSQLVWQHRAWSLIRRSSLGVYDAGGCPPRNPYSYKWSPNEFFSIFFPLCYHKHCSCCRTIDFCTKKLFDHRLL